MVTWEGRARLQICFQVKYIIPIILYPKSIPLFRATGCQTTDVSGASPPGCQRGSTNFLELRITNYELRINIIGWL